jgi:hypothetical protein
MVEQNQVLWRVPESRRGNPGPATVIKVGRKWASLDNGEKIGKESLVMECGGYKPHATYWHSPEEFERARELAAAWSSFRKAVDESWRCPKGAGINQIENARRAIFKDSQSDAKVDPLTPGQDCPHNTSDD